MNRVLLAAVQVQRQFFRSTSRRTKPDKRDVYKAAGNEQQYNKVVFYKPHNYVKPELPPPPKLFRVQRITRLRGMIYWERDIIRGLGLEYEIRAVKIVKNTPEMCALLWKVKHLISVEPITFPHGEPTVEDINYTNLNESGECIVQKKLEVPLERIEATEKFKNDPTRLDKDTLKRDALLHWLSGR